MDANRYKYCALQECGGGEWCGLDLSQRWIYHDR